MSDNVEQTQPEKSQDDINSKNSEFWDTLCGSQLATQLGIEDDSPASLKKFDDWYFEFYPYLYTHIPFDKMKDKKVLEVGLGYGTVSEAIARAGADYRGLDIAQGPVDMANHRVTQNKFKGKAVQGSILEPPFEKDSFDFVAAIGCLHHTGNLAAAIKSVHGLLKKGGEAMIMVYSANSYRQLQEAPWPTLKRCFATPNDVNAINKTDGNEKSRGDYDTDNDGAAAPQTEFVTKKELALMCTDFDSCTIIAENIGEDGVFRKMSREKALKYGKFVGLDLYCHVVK